MKRILCLLGYHKWTDHFSGRRRRQCKRCGRIRAATEHEYRASSLCKVNRQNDRGMENALRALMKTEADIAAHDDDGREGL